MNKFQKFMRKWFSQLAILSGEALWVEDGEWKTMRGLDEKDIERILERRKK